MRSGRGGNCGLSSVGGKTRKEKQTEKSGNRETEKKRVAIDDKTDDFDASRRITLLFWQNHDNAAALHFKKIMN